MICSRGFSIVNRQFIRIMQSQRFWIDNLRQYASIRDLKHSAFFLDFGPEILSFLKTPQLCELPGVTPRIGSFARITQWNIEKGKRFEAIAERLQTDELLRWSDIVILNEADVGMNRSHNRHVARELAEILGMNMAFGPAHLELTKGTGNELEIEGENSGSLQGNAILSRYPVLESCIIPLPVTFEPYEFHERRFGGRSCLWARLQLNRGSVWVGAVHLELRNTPACRALQILHIMKNLPGTEEDAHILGGDMNTNSFARGTSWRMLKSLSRFVFNAPAELRAQLLHPDSGREPLFEILENHGFSWREFNSYEETARTAIGSLEESDSLPDSISGLIRRRLEPYGGYLCFKLDWILGKHVRALRPGQKCDERTGVKSLAPGCRVGPNAGPDRVSDHLPIYADVDLN
jgi:endonuclease/exonuclease/phosphatase family metal-dependent hydrolase